MKVDIVIFYEAGNELTANGRRVSDIEVHGKSQEDARLDETLDLSRALDRQVLAHSTKM